VILPLDLMVVDAGQFKLFKTIGGEVPIPKTRGVLNHEMLPSDLPVDIGPSTVAQIKQLIGRAHTVFWNGPLGIAELEPFAAGTREVARALRELSHSQFSVICGDSLTRALRTLGLPFGQMPYITTGGEAALELLGGKSLPAVAALDDKMDLLAPVRKQSHKILAAVDGSGASLDAAGRIGRLLDTEGAEIILLYVQKANKTDIHLGAGAVQGKSREAVERRVEAERILTAANAVLARHGLVAHQRIVAEGDPAGEILKWADEMRVDLIVMGSHGHSGVLRVFLGSVSRNVLDQARCPVLIVRAVEEMRDER
jgi:nucleotide-binding universal stress UspA family protein